MGVTREELLICGWINYLGSVNFSDTRSHSVYYIIINTYCVGLGLGLCVGVSSLQSLNIAGS